MHAYTDGGAGGEPAKHTTACHVIVVFEHLACACANDADAAGGDAGAYATACGSQRSATCHGAYRRGSSGACSEEAAHEEPSTQRR